MGTSNRSSFWAPGSMAKLLCMPAWAGLTLGAPIDNTELIVNKVMDSLGPQLDSAIEAAIRMLEGSAGAGRSEAHAESHEEASKVSVEADDQEGIIEVVIDQLGPSISSAVEAALGSLSHDQARAKAEAEAAAIEAALNAQQGQAEAIAKAEAEAQAQAQAAATAAAAAEAEAAAAAEAEAAAFEQEFNEFTSSAATKTTEGDLVGQVISALTPSITEAVQAALAGQSQTTVTITQQAQAEAEAQAAALAQATSPPAAAEQRRR